MRCTDHRPTRRADAGPTVPDVAQESCVHHLPGAVCLSCHVLPLLVRLSSSLDIRLNYRCMTAQNPPGVAIRSALLTVDSRCSFTPPESKALRGQLTGHLCLPQTHLPPHPVYSLADPCCPFELLHHAFASCSADLAGCCSWSWLLAILWTIYLGAFGWRK